MSILFWVYKAEWSETYVSHNFQQMGLRKTHFGDAEGNKSLLFCGIDAENSSLQTMTSVVSLLNGKHSNINTFFFLLVFVCGHWLHIYSFLMRPQHDGNTFIFAERLILTNNNNSGRSTAFNLNNVGKNGLSLLLLFWIGTYICQKHWSIQNFYWTGNIFDISSYFSLYLKILK